MSSTPPSPPPPQPGAAACARHADRPTVLSCTRCGRPACPDCLQEASVGQHCVDCVAAAERAAPRSRNLPGADRPTVVIGLIVANVAIFLLTAAAAGGGVLTNAGSPLSAMASLAPGAVADGQWWRVVTSGFLHAGVFHLVVNMFALWLIGSDLERFMGSLRFSLLYGLSLLGGSAAVMVLAPDRPTVGASGAVFGLMGALAVILVRRGSLAAARPALIMIAVNVVLTFAIPVLSVGGHLGGLLTGALVAVALTETPARHRTGAALALAASIGVAIVATIALRALVL